MKAGDAEVVVEVSWVVAANVIASLDRHFDFSRFREEGPWSKPCTISKILTF